MLHGILYFKWMNNMLGELYLSKLVLKNYILFVRHS